MANESFGAQVDLGERRTSLPLQRSGAQLGGCGSFQVSCHVVVDIFFILCLNPGVEKKKKKNPGDEQLQKIFLFLSIFINIFVPKTKS